MHNLIEIFFGLLIVLIIALNVVVIVFELFKTSKRSTPPHSTPAVTILKPSEWTVDDVAHWREFLKTTTGQRLVDLSRAKVLTDAINGCHSTEKDASKAAGEDELLHWQFNLASDAELKRISDASADTGATNTADHEQDAMALAERRVS